MPGAEILQALLDRPDRRPALLRPLPVLHETDEVQVVAAADRIGDDVPTRADPVGADRPSQFLRQPLHRRQAAPRHQAGEGRLRAVEHLPAQGRVNAVGPDEHVAAHGAAIGQPQHHPGVVLSVAERAGVQVDRVGLQFTHGLDQDRMKLAPVNHPVRRPEALDGIGAQVKQLPGLASVPDADLLAGGLAYDGAELLLQPKLDQKPRPVRGHLKTGSQLRQLRRLLVDIDVDALLQQGQRSNQASDPASCDQHMRFQLGCPPSDRPSGTGPVARSVTTFQSLSLIYRNSIHHGQIWICGPHAAGAPFAPEG